MSDNPTVRRILEAFSPDLHGIIRQALANFESLNLAIERNRRSLTVDGKLVCEERWEPGIPWASWIKYRVYPDVMGHLVYIDSALEGEQWAITSPLT